MRDAAFVPGFSRHIFSEHTTSQKHLAPTDLLRFDAQSRSLGLGESLLNDRVEEATEEVEPFGLLDLTIAIGVEAGEEFVDFGFTSRGIGVVRKTNTLGGELLHLTSVDLTVAVEVKLVEGLFGRGESGSSGGSDVGLIFCAKSVHLLDFLLSLILSLQLIKNQIAPTSLPC